jgi:hypothetical protein
VVVVVVPAVIGAGSVVDVVELDCWVVEVVLEVLVVEG